MFPLFRYFIQAEQLREDDLEGIREHTTRQITTLEEKVVSLQLETQRQDEIIENKLKSVQYYHNSFLILHLVCLYSIYITLISDNRTA